QKDKLIHFKAQGFRDMEHSEPMQTDTVFRIYSMTKPITTVAAMMLWEEGKFKLDDPVYQYIPEFKDLNVYQATKETDSGRAMTVRDLMRHTSGLTYGWGAGPVEKMYGQKNVLDNDQPLSVMIDKLSGIPLLFNPGDKWNYSVSTDVLGYVVQQVSGKPLDVFFQERIFEPLEMNDTAFYVFPDKADRFAVNYGPDGNGGLKVVDGNRTSRFLKNPAMFSGGGGLVSTAPDYVRFCRMLVNKGTLDGQQILKKETVEMMSRNQLPEGLRTTWGTGFGLGFSVLLGIENAEEAVGEYGWSGMASTYFWILPQEDLAVVALSQIIPYSNQLADAIKQPIYAEIGLEKSSAVQAK
ncbi:MAG: serine hydrolase domain-containing protein, partial [Anaerohalosphaeraceae bacterium]